MSIAAKLGQASRVVNEDFPLVVLAGLGSTLLTGGGTWEYISMAAFVLSIFVGIVMYGRIVARLSLHRPAATLTIIRDNWFNYLLVLVLLGVPAWLAGLAAQELGSGVAGYVVRETVRAILVALTIYVVPIVYIKHENLVAIFAGVTYFVRTGRASAWIAMVAVLAYLVGATRYVLIASFELPLLVITVVAIGVAATYIHFLAFAAASDVLVNDGGAVVPNKSLETDA